LRVFPGHNWHDSHPIRRAGEMAKTLIARIVFVFMIGIAAVATSGATAAAASGPAPGTGLVGACNMLLAGAGMTNAMSRDNPQGNLGMFGAVDVSGCS
jgi:hypothetical protein